MALHVIERKSLLDIPGKLRELADQYERNPERMTTAILVVGYDDGTVAVRGYGRRTEALQCTGWLHRGLDAMTDGSMADNSGCSNEPEPPPPPA
ncbi:MAG: hypothetical protein ACRDRL_25910 [Sciscionella sp.]